MDPFLSDDQVALARVWARKIMAPPNVISVPGGSTLELLEAIERVYVDRMKHREGDYRAALQHICDFLFQQYSIVVEQPAAVYIEDAIEKAVAASQVVPAAPDHERRDAELEAAHARADSWKEQCEATQESYKQLLHRMASRDVRPSTLGPDVAALAAVTSPDPGASQYAPTAEQSAWLLAQRDREIQSLEAKLALQESAIQHGRELLRRSELEQNRLQVERNIAEQHGRFGSSWVQEAKRNPPTLTELPAAAQPMVPQARYEATAAEAREWHDKYIKVANHVGLAERACRDLTEKYDTLCEDYDRTFDARLRRVVSKLRNWRRR